MTEAQSDLAFALKMYGEKILSYAEASAADKRAAFDNMCFWQDQLMHCANAVADEKKVAK